MSTDLRQILRTAALPAGVGLLGTVELALMRPEGWPYGAALELAAAALLVARRRHPLPAATLAALMLVAIPWVGPQLNEPAAPILILAVCCYALARWLPDLRGLAGLAVVAVGFIADYALVDTRPHDVSDAFFLTALMAPPYVLGRLTRQLAEQRAELLRQQEVIRREAARAERARIARELHDVIAHSVSAMVVQTSVAEDLVPTRPERAVEVLGQVAATGRRALAETGELLQLLRDEADELGLVPASGLSRLPELVDRFRAGGLRVEAEVDGDLDGLPLGVDLAGYRIVQEALTNALRYAPDQAARLRVTRSDTALGIEAENRAASGAVNGGGSGRAGGSGLGLLGMAERVSVFGGEISHGRTGDGRFRLEVSLPLAGAAARDLERSPERGSEREPGVPLAPGQR